MVGVLSASLIQHITDHKSQMLLYMEHKEYHNCQLSLNMHTSCSSIIIESVDSIGSDGLDTPYNIIM